MHGVRQQQFVVDGGSLIAPGEEGSAGDVLVSADYFRAMSIPIVKGRAFTEHDNESATPVMVVSQSFARRYFQNGDAIGRRVRLNEQGVLSCCASPAPVDGVWREIVGVVGDITQANLDEPPSVTMYRPYLQIVEHDMFFVTRVRSGVDGPRTAAAIQRELRAIDATKEWWPIRTMERVIDESESIRLRRFVLILLGIFASLALVLAGVGLYGVMAYFVAERRREISIRVALGATRAAILEQVLLEAMRLVLVGLAPRMPRRAGAGAHGVEHALRHHRNRSTDVPDGRDRTGRGRLARQLSPRAPGRPTGSCRRTERQLT